MIPRALFVLLFIGLILSPLEAFTNARKKSKTRNPVYFPIIPIGNFNEDFGSKFSESQNTPLHSLPPLSSPKPTTTTEKLPLAQESHVASNSVTATPGPSYLTDSLYYLSDPTPSSVRATFEDNDHRGFPLFYATGSGEDKEGELGVILQSVSAYRPSFSFGKRKPLFDNLLNPAAMHYISPYSGESTEEIEVSEAPPPVQFYEPSSVIVPPVTSPSVDYGKPDSTDYGSYSHRLIQYKQPQPTATSVYIQRDPPSQESHRIRPSISSPVSSYETQRPVSPSKRYRVPNSKIPRISRPRPVFSDRSRPITNLPYTTTRRLARPTISRPVVSYPRFQVGKKSSAKTSQSGYLPKPAPNPFAAKISKSVVKPIYSGPAQIKVVKHPSKKTLNTSNRTSQHSKSNYNNQGSGQVSESRKFKSKSKGFSSRGRTYGRRKPKVVDRFRHKNIPKTSFESKRKDSNFSFNKETQSSSRRVVQPAIVTTSPVQEAPVYRTSTKAYRAPSSLYYVRGSEKKPVTISVLPEFIQKDSNIYVPHEYDEEAIPGIGGLDYPIYSTIPETSFECSSQAHPGLYADKDTNCQVFHICQEGGREDSFLCPNGTVFNQQYFVCDWWYNFSCESADRFYSLNELIYEVPEATKYRISSSS